MDIVRAIEQFRQWPAEIQRACLADFKQRRQKIRVEVQPMLPLGAEGDLQKALLRAESRTEPRRPIRRRCKLGRRIWTDDESLQLIEAVEAHGDCSLWTMRKIAKQFNRTPEALRKHYNDLRKEMKKNSAQQLEDPGLAS